jgi:hypothetical protein
MPSRSSDHWFTSRSVSLNEIEHAHRSVGGAGPGRRTATQQINQAYAVLLSSQFQGFCRDLHTECADFVIRSVPAPDLRAMLHANLLWNRKVDKGNPNAGNITSDFNRFGLSFWGLVAADHPLNARRQAALAELNDWRNAIAHQDFTAALLRAGRPSLQLSQVQTWRKALDGLARSFDNVMSAFLLTITHSARGKEHSAMNPLRTNTKLPPGPFHVGDEVTFRFVVTPVRGVVVEDRGPLGVGGRRLYGVKFRMDEVSDEMYAEMGADELQRVVADNGKK